MPYHAQELQKDNLKYSSFRLRMWNEVTTLLLFAIVFIVVLKDLGNWLWELQDLSFLPCCCLLLLMFIEKAGRHQEESNNNLLSLINYYIDSLLH